MGQDDELRKIRSELASLKADYEAALDLNNLLKQQLHSLEETLAGIQEKLGAAHRKRAEADHYKSLLHQLRGRWYLRPFIPQSELVPLQSESGASWKFRGPRFDAAASTASSDHQRQRVLVVGHLLSSKLFGSEISLLDTIAAIDSNRFDVFVVFPENNEPVFSLLRSHVQGIAVLDYAWWRLGQPTPKETLAAFEVLLHQQAIDLVHVNTIMLRAPLIAARNVGVPSIANVRELISGDDVLAARIGGTPREIVGEVCQNATYILANSATTLAEYPCGDRGSFLYNSIDERSFDLPNVVDPRCINVGMISSNLWKKGVLDFFALARLAEDVLPALQFHLIGPETAAVKEWRRGFELPGNVRLRDYVWPPPVAYHDLNLVVNLSRFGESFGRTIAEAMMARRPVIAYWHGALPELIDDGETGFLVPYLDLPALLDRLRFFVENSGKITEFGETARQQSKQRFSRETFGRGINALYERLITEEPRRADLLQEKSVAG